jgi:hypothetical protein
MNQKSKKWGILCILALWLGLSVFAWLKPTTEISEAERRKLATFPTLSVSSLLNGNFASGFENYATDQFPLREFFRDLKSKFQLNILGQLDNNDIYVVDGYAAKIEYPLDGASLNHAAERIHYIFAKYLKNTDCDVLLSIVPDKGYYLSATNGYPTLDYDSLVQQIASSADFDTYVSLFERLKLDSYYHSDTHWRQESILSAADALCEALDIPRASEQNYRQVPIDVPFYGVYRGQAALDLPTETITTLRSDILDNCRVFNYETNRYTSIYDETKLGSRDLYDIYLSGAAALLRIENPTQNNGRQLVVFRDSFGSSMIPLLVHGYETVFVVDTRYMSPDILGQFIEFDDQDVLFFYSTTVLNNSSALK